MFDNAFVFPAKRQRHCHARRLEFKLVNPENE
jgi:hypothetical protein